MTKPIERLLILVRRPVAHVYNPLHAVETVRPRGTKKSFHEQIFTVRIYVCNCICFANLLDSTLDGARLLNHWFASQVRYNMVTTRVPHDLGTFHFHKWRTLEYFVKKKRFGSPKNFLKFLKIRLRSKKFNVIRCVKFDVE